MREFGRFWGLARCPIPDCRGEERQPFWEKNPGTVYHLAGGAIEHLMSKMYFNYIGGKRTKKHKRWGDNGLDRAGDRTPDTSHTSKGKSSRAGEGE